MIEIGELTKTFGKLPVLRGVDLRIPQNCVTSIVGPNGAGKTTLIKCLLGLTRPDSGVISVDGHQLNGDWAYRSEIGYMPQHAHFPENLTGREIIRMITDLRGRNDLPDSTLLDQFELESDLDKPFQTLSGGTRQKVSAVIAFLFEPKVLILDEPTAGLDPVASSVLKDRILQEREAGRTIILTSHIMSEVEELSDRIVFLLDGAVYFDGQVKDLKEQTGQSRLERAVAQLLTRLRENTDPSSLDMVSTVAAA
ncbi:MAG: ABC transporter ATP-binding protein [Rhodothermales bacterium]|nr:ABC transporter ATP-binding protein [Rhodothermales bacterium]